MRLEDVVYDVVDDDEEKKKGPGSLSRYGWVYVSSCHLRKAPRLSACLSFDQVMEIISSLRHRPVLLAQELLPVNALEQVTWSSNSRDMALQPRVAERLLICRYWHGNSD